LNHKDHFGQALEVGDRVACIVPGYREIVTATIKKLTPKGVTVEYPRPNWGGKLTTTNRHPSNVVKAPL
jgi:hypothetical protein